MNARIDNPAVAVPGALQALQAIANAAKQADIPETTLYLVELRASQINGCGVCVDIHSRQLKHAGESDARINTVVAWRDVSYFTEAERAALALTEAATRLADRPDPVSDEVWGDAARHYDERSSARSCSRSPRSTPGTASTSPRGRSAGTGWASGSPQSRRTVRPPDADRPSSRSTRAPGRMARGALRFRPAVSSSSRRVGESRRCCLRRSDHAHRYPSLDHPRVCRIAEASSPLLVTCQELTESGVPSLLGGCPDFRVHLVRPRSGTG